jgi:hypothetical protein
MSDWKQYKRKGLSEMRPYVAGEDVSDVSISEPDKAAGSPTEGDMIARNPKNHADQWLVAKKYFDDNLELVKRIEEIADYVDTMLYDMLNESLYWQIGTGEPAPTWMEMRDAIMAKVFAVEYEMGRQELHSEQVRENCL